MNDLFAVKRLHVKQMDGSWDVHVTPPPAICRILSDIGGVHVTLSSDQFDRYWDWLRRATDAPMQELLPDLTAAQRESLLSGLTDEQFNTMTKEREP